MAVTKMKFATATHTPINPDQTGLPLKQQNLKALLASAGCALLAGLPNQVQAAELSDWDFEVATLVYVEADSRVTALEPVISATRNFDSETKLNLKLAIDTLTGASPNGATPSDQAQTFARPSGNGEFITRAGEQPLDDTFQDTRVAMAATYSAPLGRDWAYSAGGYFSKEYDYLSLGVNGSVSRYLNQKNTTLTLGGNISADTLTPEGNVPLGLSRVAVPGAASFATDFASSRGADSDDKTIVDLLLGVTQVINRRTLMQFNYSISTSDGYLSDPFKIISVIDDDVSGGNFGGNFQQAGQNLYLHEKRPDSRIKQSLYWQTKYQRGNSDIIDVSYRFMVDDWGIDSHTLDLKYRWQFGQHYLEPQLRWYSQSAADFYQRYLTASNFAATTEVSADYRLGDLDTYTLGVKYGYHLPEGNEAYARLGFYQQKSSGTSGIGKLTSQDLYPETTAMMLTAGYKF
ncbi:MAG: DUF3570 domain-containing protein [Motiliproteus sp.]